MYEDAPATKMLATHCAACARPLVDAESVTAGLGPVCRKSHGVPPHLDEQTRTRANKLVWSCATTDVTPDALTAAIVELHLLGCTKLARRISKRAGRVRLTTNALALHVDAPYSERFLAVRGPGSWDRRTRTTVYHMRNAYAALTAIREAFGPAAVVCVGKEFFRADDDRLEGTLVGMAERASEMDPEPVTTSTTSKPIKGVGSPRRLHSGEWGVHLAASDTVSPGDRIVVRTRGGREWYADLKERVATGDWGALWRTTRC